MRGSTAVSRETGRERGAKASGTRGPSRRPQEPAVHSAQDATVPGQSASGEAEDVGIKGQLSGAAAEAPGIKANSSWKPRTSSTSQAEPWGCGLGQHRELGVVSGPCTEARITEWGGKFDHTRGGTRMALVLLRRLN